MIELHEASHATIARALEIEVVHVVTDPADPHVRTRHRPGGTVGERIALLEKLAMVDLAGAVSFEPRGPCLLIEFCRVSKDGRLTLVIDELFGTP
jgi:hypothetical protein